VEGDQLVARVRDAGPGFVPSQVQSSGGRHVGLGLLRERARLAGGSLDVTTAPGEGTELTLRLPLSPRTAMMLGDSAPPVPETTLRPEPAQVPSRSGAGLGAEPA
jgi:signal transduction histidine kinase